MSVYRRVAIVLSVAFVCASATAQADTITEQRIGTVGIVIPNFNTSLGTLDSVDLTVRLDSDSTSLSGSHGHSIQSPITSTNQIQSNDSDDIHLLTSVATTSTNGGHLHGGSTPAYSGGGFSFTPFDVVPDANNGHTHQVTANIVGFIEDTNPFGPEDFNVRIALTVTPFGVHGHDYAGSQQMQNFTGGGVSPFEVASDIVIAASPFALPSDGSHTHSLAPFSLQATTSEGPAQLQFSSVSLGGASDHFHQVNPRFTTTAVFTYTAAVPEPSTWVLGVAGISALVVVYRRR